MRYLGLCLFLLQTHLLAQPKAIFYLTSNPDSIRSFVSHAGQIDLVIPTVYSADEQGLVWGEPDPLVIDTARKHRVPVMPIIVNPGFRQETIRALLASPEARRRVAAALLEECRRWGYYGIQFDFENVPFADRSALSAFVRETSEALAGGGFKLSIATVHKTADYPGRGAYAHWLYADWRGAYDLAEISRHVEFISVMAYDQHTRRTPPGPVAGFPWVQQVLEYSLKLAPAEKISLGIPLYGRHWYAGIQEKEASMQMVSINAPDAAELAARMGAEVQWDPVERAPWFYFYRDGVREYVFYNDARSFRARYELARDRNLHSFSAWVLGAEDPGIWSELPAARR